MPHIKTIQKYTHARRKEMAKKLAFGMYVYMLYFKVYWVHKKNLKNKWIVVYNKFKDNSCTMM